MPKSDAKKSPHPRPPSVEPDRVESDYDRRQMLLYLIDKHGGGVSEFSRNARISRVHLEQLLSGVKDLWGMRQETVEKLLTALNMPDTEAWQKLKIPEDQQKRWRTLRPPPMGHGDLPRNITDIVLDLPLLGDVNVPSGYAIAVDLNDTTGGLVVTRFSDRYYATPAEAQPSGGQLLGRLIRVDTLIRRS